MKAIIKELFILILIGSVIGLIIAYLQKKFNIDQTTVKLIFILLMVLGLVYSFYLAYNVYKDSMKDDE